MSDVPLSLNLQRFINEHIASVEKLEILLLLSNSTPREWSVADVYQQIQSNLNSVKERLNELVAAGLIVRNEEDCFRFQPKARELEEQVAALRNAYQMRPVAVIQFIFSQSADES